MTPRCREIQELLAEHGPAVLRDHEGAQAHVAECEECFQLLEAFAELEPALAALPTLDAPDPVVESVLARTAEPAPAPAPAPVARERRGRAARSRARVIRYGGVVAAGLASLLLVVVFVNGPLLFPAAVMDRDDVRSEVARQGAALKIQPHAQSLDSLGNVVGTPEQAPELQGPADELRQPAGDYAEAPAAPPVVDKLEMKKDESGERAAGVGRMVTNYELDQRIVESKRWRRNETFAYVSKAPEEFESRSDLRSVRRVQTAQRSGEAGSKGRAKKPAPVGVEFTFDDLEDFDGGDTQVSLADAFWNERRSRQGVTFQPAEGYWANTYVPGDPLLRWLEARVAARSASATAAGAAQPVRLDAGARPTTQPFDPPESSALGVFLHADRASLDGETRMLVQVGLQGAQRHAGLRPGMNVAVVLDARGASSGEEAAALRALTDALLGAREIGDRFSLILAGRPASTAVEAESFRHGPLQVALLGLVEPPSAAPGGLPLGLTEALERAVETLSASDDPTAPLGSSLVLLATAQPLGAETAALEAIAHRSAVAGIPVSVAGVGERVAPAELERIALAGQGNRRLLESPADAERVIERELSAQGRAIARAARLRIRLAPGVKLIDVVGSERHDAAGATRVRQAEQSIDRRLSRNLGIEADRGEDEEGIQIVIPTFYAGDAHVVLLDVVAPGPGPVADVTLRYKDLVYLRNGVARANLTLPASGPHAAEPGPLERNVIKNLLAIRLAERLESASDALRTGQDALAVAILTDTRALLRGIARAPEYGRDPDLRADLDLLDEYLAALATQDAMPRDDLAESLKLSSYFKTVPRTPVD